MAGKIKTERKQDNLNGVEEICKSDDLEFEFEEDRDLYGYCSDNKQGFG